MNCDDSRSQKKMRSLVVLRILRLTCIQVSINGLINKSLHEADNTMSGGIWSSWCYVASPTKIWRWMR